MTKIKLVDGTIINASEVEVVNGVLKITTTDHTVEELAEIFSNKSKTSLITFLTEGDEESGFETGFTSFAGIIYGADGAKTVELFQPVDATEQRISNAEGAAAAANTNAENVAKETAELQTLVNTLLGTETEAE